MSNGDDQQINCALGICCGGEDGAKQVKAISELIAHDLGDGPASVSIFARWIVDHFDLAEKGTLQAFKDSIAKYARGFDYQG